MDFTLEQMDEILHPTVRQLTNNINRLYEKSREWSPEEEQRYQLNIDMRDYVKTKYNLWPPDPYAEE
jgi:hypothetical protein